LIRGIDAAKPGSQRAEHQRFGGVLLPRRAVQDRRDPDAADREAALARICHHIIVRRGAPPRAAARGVAGVPGGCPPPHAGRAWDRFACRFQGAPTVSCSLVMSSAAPTLPVRDRRAADAEGIATLATSTGPAPAAEPRASSAAETGERIAVPEPAPARPPSGPNSRGENDVRHLGKDALQPAALVVALVFIAFTAYN